MKSIDQVYQLYFRDVYHFLLSLSRDHYTAEDLVQETFLRLICIWNFIIMKT